MMENGTHKSHNIICKRKMKKKKLCAKTVFSLLLLFDHSETHLQIRTHTITHTNGKKKQKERKTAHDEHWEHTTSVKSQCNAYIFFFYWIDCDVLATISLIGFDTYTHSTHISKYISNSENEEKKSRKREKRKRFIQIDFRCSSCFHFGEFISFRFIFFLFHLLLPFHAHTHTYGVYFQQKFYRSWCAFLFSFSFFSFGNFYCVV